MAELEFGAARETSASPDEVLAGVVDFTERRADIWPSVSKGHFEVHTLGDDFAEVTEELWPIGFWERGRYDWSDPRHVKQTVLESNGLVEGSTWEVLIAPTDRGSRVETIFRRDFLRTGRGRLAEAINRFGGRYFAKSDLRKALKEIEKTG